MPQSTRHVLMLSHVLEYQKDMDKRHLEIPVAHVVAVGSLMARLCDGEIPDAPARASESAPVAPKKPTRRRR